MDTTNGTTDLAGAGTLGLELDESALFVRFAAARGWLDEAAAEMLLGLQTLDRMRGRRRSLGALARAEGLLTPEQARAVEERILYEAARRVDRAYGRIACERGFLERSTLAVYLAAQKKAVIERRVMPRLPRLLARAGRITPAQDEALRADLARALADAGWPDSPAEVAQASP
jgi:hypothetical protein